MLVEKSFQTKSGTLNYAEGPDAGPPLILLHGITANWTCFMPLMALLSQRWHIYAPDLRGHGKSSHVPGQYRITGRNKSEKLYIESLTRVPTRGVGFTL